MKRSVLEGEDSNNGNAETYARRQWEALDRDVRLMSLLTEENRSSLSSSPIGHSISNNPPVAGQVQNPVYNPHRKSEGQIKGQELISPMVDIPPQSAPALQMGFALNWDNLPQLPVSRVAFSAAPENLRNPISKTGNLNYAQLPSHAGSESLSTPMFTGQLQTENNFTLHKDTSAPSMYSLGNKNQDNSLCSRNASSTNAGLSDGSHPFHSSVSMPVLSGFYHKKSPYSHSPPNQPPAHSSKFPVRNENVTKPLLYETTSATSMRRQSVPVQVPNTLTQVSHPKQLNRTASPLPIPNNSFNALQKKSLINGKVSTSHIQNEKPDDQGYIVALLQHQKDRMQRLQVELHQKKKERRSLATQVKMTEAKLEQRNVGSKSASPIPTLQEDVGRLREANRKLEIDCNCMHKEVDLFSREGDSTRESFYSRYDSPSIKSKAKRERASKPPAVRAESPPEEPKWTCTYCTFDNHAALTKCEVCEFSREVVPARTNHP